MMYKGKGIIIVLLIVFCLDISAQELTQQVLLPVGAIVTTGNMHYSHSIGENAIEIFKTPDKDLTQGFQQPLIKFVKDIQPPGNGVKVYPNPATDFVNIEIFGERAQSFKLDIITITGTIIKTEQLSFVDAFWWVKRMPTDHLSRGLYFIRIVSQDGIINRTFKIDIM